MGTIHAPADLGFALDPTDSTVRSREYGWVRAKLFGWDAGDDSDVADEYDDPTVEGTLTFRWVESLGYWQFLVGDQLVDPNSVELDSTI